jgi:ferredoxin
MAATISDHAWGWMPYGARSRADMKKERRRAGSGMRVLVDLALCEGNGRCEATAPELFIVGDDDKSQVTNESPPDNLREKALLAAKLCPRQAIKVVE